jgi:transcriptional regulator with XRE-family HTH domain
MNIGTRIKYRRKELRMSADKLAEILGKDRSTIYRYEKGDIENLPLDILEPIAQALGTTPAYLMGWEDDKKANAPEELILSEDEIALINAFRQIPEEKQKAFIDCAHEAPSENACIASECNLKIIGG